MAMEFKQSWAVLQEKHPGFCALLRTIYSSEDPVDAKMTRARQALEYMLQARCLSLHRAYTDIHKTLGMLQQKGDMEDFYARRRISCARLPIPTSMRRWRA